ncbi:MAG: cell filamentation protein Fic [Robiginitomaculum sp.]|nr:MAG: cell filamentation protein Fic [Robiginitomaculum sp.]
MYIHEQQAWPEFYWNDKALTKILATVRHRQGRLVGRMESLGFELRAEAVLQTLTADVLKSSEIEGDILDEEQVRSSIARRLGMDIAGLTRSERHVDCVVEMMLDATQNYEAPLSDERLFGWHAALFPTGHSGMRKITVSAWRNDNTGPMQVVSGATGREQVHFQAPPASDLDQEMKTFLYWFNQKPDIDLVIKSAVAHLWFVTVHPFEDGNGRIARALADLMLARSEQSAQRFYSMSTQIRLERKAYYNILESTQKGTLDITDWIKWYLACLNKAFDGAEIILRKVLQKSKFWEIHKDKKFNERQRQVTNHLLDGFKGKLTSSKWAKLTKCSQDTAIRDINVLVKQGVLIKAPEGGRSTSYTLVVGDDVRQLITTRN